MLAMHPNCQHCHEPLAPASEKAFICSYECTFCATCANDLFEGICPNCDGELLNRPKRIKLTS